MMLTKSNEDPSPLFSLPDGRSSRQGHQGFVTLFWQQYPPTMSTPLGASTTAQPQQGFHLRLPPSY